MTMTSTATPSTGSPPIETVRMGGVSASIWRNVNDQGQARFNVSYQRSYMDANGEWKHSEYFSREENLLLSKVADLAHTRVRELMDAEREQSRNAASVPAGAGHAAEARSR